MIPFLLRYLNSLDYLDDVPMTNNSQAYGTPPPKKAYNVVIKYYYYVGNKHVSHSFNLTTSRPSKGNSQNNDNAPIFSWF